MKPPTWRALAARARRLRIDLVHGRHGAWLRGADYRLDVESWDTRSVDAIILRAAVAAALEQLEARR